MIQGGILISNLGTTVLEFWENHHCFATLFLRNSNKRCFIVIIFLKIIILAQRYKLCGLDFALELDISLLPNPENKPVPSSGLMRVH